MVMRCLAALCEDGQLLVDVFVNYDCDLEGANLFERLVTALVRIAQARALFFVHIFTFFVSLFPMYNCYCLSFHSG